MWQQTTIGINDVTEFDGLNVANVDVRPFKAHLTIG